MKSFTQGVSVSNDNDTTTYTFTIFAPEKERVSIQFGDDELTKLDMEKQDYGYWIIRFEKDLPHHRYKFIVDDIGIPDPASHYQPDGVHGFSEVVDHSKYKWTDDAWNGIDWNELIIYELHPGTFSEEGTFEGIETKLPYLKELGITAIEIMPIAAFPGKYNWGYDGALLFAVDETYGGPFELKSLVNACHEEGIAVILDCVFNHLGPEGGYHSVSAPIFNERYSTPWGPALNYDNKYSYGIRQFVTQNIEYWIEEYHIDGFRLDAIDDIYDRSAYHILEEIQDTVERCEKRLDRQIFVIAETAMHDPKITLPQERGGYGISGQWQDEFHHTMHVLLTGETDGYYGDYQEGLEYLKACFGGFVYQYDYSSHRKAVVGYPPSKDVDPDLTKMVTFIDNHDQIGNRLKGDRLIESISFDELKVGAGILLTAPFTPMIFMGGEFGADTPFYFFVDFSEDGLKKAVREGRKRDYAERYHWTEEPKDPVDPDSFYSSKLSWDTMHQERNRDIFDYYKELIQFRKKWLIRNREVVWVKVVNDCFTYAYEQYGQQLVHIANFGAKTKLCLSELIESDTVHVLIDSKGLLSDQMINTELEIAENSFLIVSDQS